MTIAFDKLSLSQGSFTLTADFTVEEGHKIALIGPSGGGKSTLLSAIAGFHPISKGSISFRGQDMGDQSPATRPVSLLFQDHNLFPHLSVSQNIALGLRPNLRLSKEDQARVTQAIERVGLTDHAQKLPSEISGGQQQRVALARILLRDKPILLLDEPFAALGPALKNEMLDLVSAIVDEHKATLLMVTHQPEDAIYIADQVVLIAEGQAHPPQDTQAIFHEPPAALAEYLGSKRAHEI